VPRAAAAASRQRRDGNTLTVPGEWPDFRASVHPLFRHAAPEWLHPQRTEITVKTLSIATLALALAGAFVALPAPAQDANAAQALLKKENCTKCHSVDKTKKGPAYQKVAAKYKGKADAQEKLEKFLTTSPKVKLDDGTEEEHKAVKDKAAMNNMIKWVLSL
jgi:cytochrome c